MSATFHQHTELLVRTLPYGDFVGLLRVEIHYLKQQVKNTGADFYKAALRDAQDLRARLIKGYNPLEAI